MAPDPHGAKSQDVCGFYGLDLRPFSGPERPGRNDANYLLKKFEKLGVSKVTGPVTPQYATYSSRLKTFENWTIPDIQSPEKLAEAGFFYTSTQDNVLCFHCGGGLKNWEVDDDPWVEHARWFSGCGFVILQKGREFISEVLAKDEGYSSSEPVTKPKSESETKSEINKKEEKSISKPSSTTSTSTSTSTEETNRRPNSPNLDKKELSLCRICYTNERAIVFLPCGHFVSCSQCAPSLSSCAVCRKPFEAVVRAYLS